jgi:hypothetical protein
LLHETVETAETAKQLLHETAETAEQLLRETVTTFNSHEYAIKIFETVNTPPQTWTTH